MKPLCQARGIVVKWDSERGFGFIRVIEENHGSGFEEIKGKKDAFAHYKKINLEQFIEKVDGKEVTKYRKLIEEQVVEFDLYRSPRGFSAENIIIIGSRVTEEGDVSGNY